MNKSKFEARAGRRAGLRKALRGTLDYLVKREAVNPDDAAAYASGTDEDTVERVIAILLREIISLELKVEAAADMLRQADKTLELILQAQEVEKLAKAA